MQKHNVLEALQNSLELVDGEVLGDIELKASPSLPLFAVWFKQMV